MGDGCAEELGEALGGPDGLELALAVAVAETDGEGRDAALVDPHAESRRMATTQGANLKRPTVFWGMTARQVGEGAGGVVTSMPTPLCEGGYVSGTIHRLKQGSDPHPQGSAQRG